MMIYPSINKLMKPGESRYTLVVEAAKRARQLAAGDKPLVYCDSDKPVTVATNEIYQGKISFIRNIQ